MQWLELISSIVPICFFQEMSSLSVSIAVCIYVELDVELVDNHAGF
jgi:hypothetical protein